MHATVIENLIEKFEQLPGIGRKSAERTLENITPFIERKLFLKVNLEKNCMAHISKVKYLGYFITTEVNEDLEYTQSQLQR